MSQTSIKGAGIFNCPTCNEMIYSDATICRFCSAPVDREAAAFGAHMQAEVNTACNLAKTLRHLSVSMWVFFLVSFVLAAVQWAFTGLMIFLPLGLPYWQFKYRKLKTNDPDFKKAKRDWLVALIVWLPAPVIAIVMAILTA